ncbi:MAG TPA: alcohol dehydrogenase catalytic domain-containing protein [Gaiellaceae bacterium]|nr:alcohol dehydrogenase catalytic domain-containing protein [Gaiellaceae bacterium]
MKAAVFYEPNDLRVENVPEPQIADDEVLVEVAACGFCGSDVEYYYGNSPVGTADGKGPLVLGHEFAGRVVGLGRLAGSYGLAEGDRVAVNPIQSCNACMSCRSGRPQFCANLSVLGVTTNGGFAQYAKTKVAHAYKLSDALTDEQGAFIEMLSAAVNAVRKADVQPEDFVVVYGPGPVGLSMVQLLKNEGARVAMVGTGGYRLDLAKSLGADHVFTAGEGDLSEQVRAANDGALADKVIVATSSMAANQEALAVSGPGSTVVYMGVTSPDAKVELPMLSSLIQDKTIHFSLWYPFQWPTTIRILAGARIDTGKLITHTAPLDGIAQAIERVVNREDGVIKTLVKP